MGSCRGSRPKTQVIIMFLAHRRLIIELRLIGPAGMLCWTFVVNDYLRGRSEWCSIAHFIGVGYTILTAKINLRSDWTCFLVIVGPMPSARYQTLKLGSSGRFTHVYSCIITKWTSELRAHNNLYIAPVTVAVKRNDLNWVEYHKVSIIDIYWTLANFEWFKFIVNLLISGFFLITIFRSYLHSTGVKQTNLNRKI